MNVCFRHSGLVIEPRVTRLRAPSRAGFATARRWVPRLGKPSVGLVFVKPPDGAMVVRPNARQRRRRAQSSTRGRARRTPIARRLHLARTGGFERRTLMWWCSRPNDWARQPVQKFGDAAPRGIMHAGWSLGPSYHNAGLCETCDGASVPVGTWTSRTLEREREREVREKACT